MTPDERTLLERATVHFGAQSQLLKTLEELTELMMELWIEFKNESEHQGRATRTDNLLEEVADVRIMLDQLEILFGSSNEFRRVKLERLRKRMHG